MSALLITLHVIVCITLIMIVLLQTGKGADMGAAFGGGSSQTLFGSTGASTFLGKATTVAAVIFMLTSLCLAYISTHKTASSIMTDAEIETPAKPEVPAAAQEQAKPAQEAASQVVEIPVNQATQGGASSQVVEIPVNQANPVPAAEAKTSESSSSVSEKPVSKDTKTK